VRLVLACIVAYAAGSIPFSNIAARRRAGVDLRDVGHGTVSGTGLHQVAGFGPLVVAGLCDVAKGCVGPLLLWDHTVPMAIAGACALVGHNWSVFLRGAGGRGISTAMGALAVIAWPGSVLLLAGLAFGRLLGETALGSLVSQALLVPVLAAWAGAAGAVAAVAILVPMWGKRVAGNRWPPEGPMASTLLARWLVDRDSWAKPADPTASGAAAR
jgi:glycerol-3-phosphate acyltransferase PlsY